MNRRLDDLQPYPFERLRQLLADVPAPALRPVRLSIGEPQHPTPALIRHALVAHLDGLSTYPTTAGSDALRAALAAWACRRYHLKAVDAATQVLPVNGTREALFALAQAVIEPGGPQALVACPNPFYQIYEGAAVLAGARPVFLNQTAANRWGLDVETLPPSNWASTQLLYVCSPGNPTGHVLTLEDWRRLFALSDTHGFVIASDECYSDIYPDEGNAPLGALQAAQQLGRTAFHNLAVFVSLSKRSNAPGLRSGAVIGDAAILAKFLRYRTYHGCAMSLAVQHASMAAWSDESHVRENRDLYRAKFEAIVPMLQPVLGVVAPEAGFYLWAQVPGGDDEAYARRLFAEAHVTVLPGQYLGRQAHGINPGRGYVRMALVAPFDECVEAAARIAALPH